MTALLTPHTQGEKQLGIPPNLGRVVCYGAGVDSTAMLIAMRDAQVVPDIITTADTGAEKPEFYTYLDTMDRWLAEQGWPLITRCQYKPKDSTPYTTLEGELLHNQTMPSLAFGMKSCSIKWKQAPQDAVLKGVRRGPNKRPAHPLWTNQLDEEGKLVKLIGYDFSRADIRRSGRIKTEDAEFLYGYPLQALTWSRGDCVARIVQEGLPVPIKSACYFCPASQKWELWWLAGTHPELFLKALHMEHLAMLGRHSRWEGGDCDYGDEWEEWAFQKADKWPSTSATVGLGRGFNWNHWARQNQIVHADGRFVRNPDRYLAKAEELREKGGNAEDRRCVLAP